MAIEHNGKIIRSLPEQVAKNLTDIIKLMADITALTNLVNSKLTGAMHYKGSVATVADLPSTGNEIGDFYNVTDTGANYAWDGTQWDDIGSIVDLAPYARKDQDNTFSANNEFTGDIKVDNIYDTDDEIIFKVYDIDDRVAKTSYTIIPTTVAEQNLGDPVNYYKTVYATEISNGVTTFSINDFQSMNQDIGVIMQDYITSQDLANYVTTNTEQTIPVVKSFNAKKLRVQEGTQFWTFDMDASGSYLDIMYNGTNTVMSITRTGIVTRQNFYPQNDNSNDLGLPYKGFRDAVIKRNLSDGTNSVTVADLAALITYAKAQGWIS